MRVPDIYEKSESSYHQQHPEPTSIDVDRNMGPSREEMERQRSESVDSRASFHSSHRLPQDLQTYIVRRLLGLTFYWWAHAPVFMQCVFFCCPCATDPASQELIRASHATEKSIVLPSDSAEETKPLKSLTKTQIFTLVSICFTTTCSASFYSLLAPFFSTEAIAKGATTTEVGFIFGIFQGIVFIMSPIYGRYIVQIGPKFMYVTGIFVASSCAILFGTLEWCPSGQVYVIMCFVTRSVEALAAAATSTASLAIAAHTFPDNLSKVMGLIEVCSSLGLMLGPPVGGLLFTAGGFSTPFYVSGGLFMLGGLLSFIIMPVVEGERNVSKTSHWGLLKLPIIFIVGYMVLIGQASIGFFDVGLAPQISKFTQSEAIIGLVFLVPSVSVIILAPINGTLVDKNRKFGHPIIVIGSSLGALGVLGLGPSPLMPYLPTDEIWVPIVSLAIAGMGLSCLVVTYQAFVGAALDAGYVITMEMQGIISGTYNAFNSLGALIGPTVGGVMLGHLSFEWSATIFGFAIGLAAVMMLVYTLITMVTWPCRRDPAEDRDYIINGSI